MIVYVAQFQTVSDLDDLRDCIHDQIDVDFITSVPHLVSRDRDDLIARVMNDLRVTHAQCLDDDDDDFHMMLVIDDEPDIDLMSSRTVMLADEFYAHIHITAHHV